MVLPELPGRSVVVGSDHSSGPRVIGMQAVRAVPLWTQRGEVTSALLTTIGVILWAGSVPSIDPRQATDLGLVVVLPPLFYVALAALVIGFMIGLNTRPLPTPALLFNIVSLIVMVHGLRAVAADGTHLATTWVHLGFMDVISRTGGLLPEVDARFSWPVFFALGAMVGETVGADLGSIIPWVPMGVNLLLLPSLLLLYRSFSSDMRLAWLACFVFFATNWVGQDYLSPQAFAFLTYLCVLGLALTWFAPRHRDHSASPIDSGIGADGGSLVSARRQRAGLMLCIVLLFAALVPSHQLTPFALIGALSALVVFRMTWLRALPMLLAVMTGAWISYMTVPFLAGHVGGLLAQVGSTEAVATENVAARIAGSADHTVIVIIRLGATLMVWGLAGLGVIRRIRNGHWDASAALLAGAPMALLLLQSYGGEMLQRIYLFGLPFMAFLVAGLFIPRRESLARPTNFAISGMLAIMLVVLMFTRFGNERIDLMTAQEQQAIAELHEIARPGSTFITVNHNSPLRSQNLEEHQHGTVTHSAAKGDIDGIVDVLQQAPQPAFLLMSRSQQAWAELMEGMPRGAWEKLRNGLAARDDVRIVFENSDAVVFRPVPAEGRIGD